MATRVNLCLISPYHLCVLYLVVHTVDAVWSQQINGLANEVRTPTVEHPKTQV